MENAGTYNIQLANNKSWLSPPPRGNQTRLTPNDARVSFATIQPLQANTSQYFYKQKESKAALNRKYIVRRHK